jgi:hypothetical protein
MAARGIAQQYSPTTFISLRFSSVNEKLCAIFKTGCYNKLLLFFFFFFYF